MKYKCKGNDAIIELGKSKDELLISIEGETVKTIIGLKDLKQALILFGVNGLLPTEEEIKNEAKYRQMEGAEPHSWEGGARWAISTLKNKL